jgi:hypothetical protein
MSEAPLLRLARYLAWIALFVGTVIWTGWAALAALMSAGFVGVDVVRIPIFWFWVLSPLVLWALCLIFAKRLLRAAPLEQQ